MTKRQLFAAGAILAVSLATHFAWFGRPDETVFDEVHFGKFVEGYYTHEYFFDIHPPLGKLMIAGFAKLFDFKPAFSFAKIGEKFPDHKYLALRFLPALAGALLAPVLYFLALELGFSQIAAESVGALIAFENALVAHSRLILLDSFLLLFGFSALWCYLRWRNGGVKWLLLGAGTLGGMAMSVKWTGATFLGLIAVMELLHLWGDRHGTARRRLIPIIVTLAVVPLALYSAVFAVHFALLAKSGPGDAFMSPAFQKTLRGNTYEHDASLAAPGFVQKFVELNEEMYRSNQRLTATHPYGSAWYTWPFMQRPVFYWVNAGASIYLLGNPVMWWGSTAAIIFLATSFLTDPRNPTHLYIGVMGKRTKTAAILLGGYFLNLLPFIGITRVMFLYHYLIALVFAVMALVYVVSRTRQPGRNLAALVLVSLAAFAYFAPLTYGLPLTPNAHNKRLWLKSWE